MTAQHYRHFALYFEGSAIVANEEYDTADEMLTAVDQWLIPFRQETKEKAIWDAKLNPLRTSNRVLVHSTFTVLADDPIRVQQDVVLCSIPQATSKHSVVVTDENGNQTEVGPFTVEINSVVNGHVIQTAPGSLAQAAFDKEVQKFGKGGVKLGQSQLKTQYNGFVLEGMEFKKTGQRVELVVVPGSKNSALVQKFATL